MHPTGSFSVATSSAKRPVPHPRPSHELRQSAGTSDKPRSPLPKLHASTIDGKGGCFAIPASVSMFAAPVAQRLPAFAMKSFEQPRRRLGVGATGPSLEAVSHLRVRIRLRHLILRQSPSPAATSRNRFPSPASTNTRTPAV